MAKKSDTQNLIPLEAIESRIFVLRGHRVMLDRDLAELYGVETRALNQAVKRNADRFPDDFMFKLTLEEAKAVLALRSQFVTLKRGEHLKYAPHAFTEHGAVMLANVLKSPVAIRASIQVVRAFVRLRQMLATNDDLARKIEALERKVGKHPSDLEGILGILKQLLVRPPAADKSRIWVVVSHKQRTDRGTVAGQVRIQPGRLRIRVHAPPFAYVALQQLAIQIFAVGTVAGRQVLTERH